MILVQTVMVGVRLMTSSQEDYDKLWEHKTYWWRLACGYRRILEKVKNKVLPPDEYYTWAEQYIDSELADLDEKVR